MKNEGCSAADNQQKIRNWKEQGSGLIRRSVFAFNYFYGRERYLTESFV